MKRKIILVLILILFISGLVFGVIWLLNPAIFSQSDAGDKDDLQTEINIVRYPVVEGEIAHTYEIDAQVISGAPEIYTADICVENITDSNFSLKKNKGDLIAPDEVLYVYDGKEHCVDFNGRILEIDYQKTENNKSAVITLLNYDNLFITANIEMEKLDKINYNTPVTVIFNGDEAEAKIDTIGFEITDGTLPLNITLPMKLYPGTPVKLVFTLEVIESGIYLPEEAIYSQGDE